MPTVKKLPAPDWTGVPDDVVERFATFMATEAQERNQHIPDELREEMRRAERLLAGHRENKTNLERKIHPLRSKERRLKRQLNDRKIKNDAALLDQIEQIHALPYVTGTRVDETGRLVVQLRLQVVQLGKVRDMGDFELTMEGRLYDRRSNTWRYRLMVIRDTTDGDDIDGFEPDYNGNDRDGTYDGYTHNFQNPKDFIGNWKFADLVSAVADHLIKENLLDEAHFDEEELQDEDNADFPILFGEPNTIWDGYVANPVKALRRSIELHEGTVEYQLAEVTEKLSGKLYDLELAKAGIREWDVKARTARAAYEAQQGDGAHRIVIRFEDVVENIATIMRFPGVMGMRFTGGGVPVVYVRSTFEYFGKRFDGGDFEIRLQKEPDRTAEGGLKTRSLRTSGRYYGERYRHYYHPNGDYSWFCYGDRSREIRRLFTDGEYASAMHLAINTINSINIADQIEETIVSYYPRIPMPLVWRSEVRIEPVEPVEPVAETVETAA